MQGIAYLIAFNTLVATGNLARFDFGDFANQSCAWVLALCISLLVYRLLPKDLERRATGTGWALGVGRFGSILGPLFGSLLLGMHISVENIFMLAAIPAGLAALLILQVRSPAAQAQRESAAALAVEES